MSNLRSSPSGPGLPTIAQQLNWNPTNNSNVLTLVPAGHTPGQYEVTLTLVVLSTSTGTANPAVTWNSPTFGSENKTLGVGMQLSSIGTSATITGTTSIPLRAFALVSDGSAPIRLSIPATVGSGLVDIYASARLIAVF